MFKSGDLVYCVDAGYPCALTKGKIYKLEAVFRRKVYNSPRVLVINDRGNKEEYSSLRFSEKWELPEYSKKGSDEYEEILQLETFYDAFKS